MTVHFKNVNLVTMKDHRVVENSSLTVKDGKITGVGKPPQGEAFVVDCEGGYLMPSFSDMHVHLEARGKDGSYVSGTHREAPLTDTDFNEFLKSFIANGVTLVRNMAGCQEILDTASAVERGEILGPHIVTTSPITEGTPPSGPGRILLTDEETARAVVRSIKEAGYFAVKIYNNTEPHIFDAVMDEAEKVGIKVCGHVPIPVGIDHALESNMWTFEHVRAFPRRVVKKAGEMRKVWTPTLVIEKCDPLYFKNPKAYKEKLQWAKTRPISYEMLKGWQDLQEIILNHDFRQDRSYEEYRQDVKVFVDHGGIVLSGTDSGFPFCVGGESLPLEIIELTVAGLTPFEALCTTTVWPGKVLGLERGTLEEGKDGDLVLLGGNPLKDIGAVLDVRGVMSWGKWFDGKALDELKGQAMKAAVRK